jgi:ribosomal-protein-alanine N-acetyltransferase
VNILGTERLFLRHLRADDADFILELLNEPAFLQNIGDRGVRIIADACRYIVAGPVTSNSVSRCTWWR